MRLKRKSRSRITYVIFWLLLTYIVAALVWWFISLREQNDDMYAYKLHQAELRLQQTADSSLYNAELAKAKSAFRTNRVKYSGEGIVFLGLILVGAIFLFRLLRRQIVLQQQQQNFMMAVTHELKTPIAVARLNLETMMKYQLDPDKRLKIIQMTLDETKRLDFLTNNILVSSQLETRGYKINSEEIDFSLLLKDRLSEFTSRFPDRLLKGEIDEDAEVNGDPLLLQILVNNLLENAIKYTDKDSQITVRLEKRNSGIILKVIDEGPGVPDAEKKKIFRKFYRVGNEATRKKQGSGLGLYLCYRIARDHHADISVTDNQPKGSIFVVEFKK